MCYSLYNLGYVKKAQVLNIQGYCVQVNPDIETIMTTKMWKFRKLVFVLYGYANVSTN